MCFSELDVISLVKTLPEISFGGIMAGGAASDYRIHIFVRVFNCNDVIARRST